MLGKNKGVRILLIYNENLATIQKCMRTNKEN